MVVHTHNPSTREAEAGGFKDQGHPQLQSEFEASMGCMRPGTCENTESMKLSMESWILWLQNMLHWLNGFEYTVLVKLFFSKPLLQIYPFLSLLSSLSVEHRRAPDTLKQLKPEQESFEAAEGFSSWDYSYHLTGSRKQSLQLQLTMLVDQSFSRPTGANLPPLNPNHQTKVEAHRKQHPGCQFYSKMMGNRMKMCFSLS